MRSNCESASRAEGTNDRRNPLIVILNELVREVTGNRAWLLYKPMDAIQLPYIQMRRSDRVQNLGWKGKGRGNL